MTKKLRILLVEDDESIREVCKRFLEVLGHTVVAEAEDGGEAIGIFEQNRNGFDLVLTDNRMPWVTGPKVAHFVRGLRPLMPIIIMSGVLSEIQPEGHECVVLEKPFKLEQLAAAIEDALRWQEH